MELSLPGGPYANGTAAALIRPADAPAPVINIRPEANTTNIAFMTGRDGASGARPNTAEDAGLTVTSIVHD